MSTIVPIVFQISEEQKQVISKIAASVAPLVAPCDCVLLTLICAKTAPNRQKVRGQKDNQQRRKKLNPAKQETFTVAEAAYLLNVSPTTMYRLIYTGQLKILRSFGRIRISKQQLDRLLSQTEIYTPCRSRRK